jgi:hypothetical protein
MRDIRLTSKFLTHTLASIPAALESPAPSRVLQISNRCRAIWRPSRYTSDTLSTRTSNIYPLEFMSSNQVMTRHLPLIERSCVFLMILALSLGSRLVLKKKERLMCKPQRSYSLFGLKLWPSKLIKGLRGADQASFPFLLACGLGRSYFSLFILR